MKWWRVTTWAVVAVLAIVLGVSTVYRSGPHQFGTRQWGSQHHRTDFTVYHAAGRAVIEGTNIYEATNPRGWVYQYLPVFAVLMAPLALLNYFWSSLIWYLLSLTMLGHTVWMTVRLVRRFYPEHRMADFWVGVLAVLALLWPCLSGMARGQASLLVMWLVTLCIWLALSQRPWSAGLALAGAIVLKIFPGLLLVYWVARRRWTLAVATTVWLAVLMFVLPGAMFGTRGNAALLQQWVRTVAMPANRPDQSAGDVRYSQMISPYLDRNQSVQALAIRWIAGSRENTADRSREPLARKVAMGINLTLLLVSAWAFSRGGKGQVLLEVCVVILLMLFLSPVSWSHNYTVLVLPLGTALALGFGANARSMRWAVIVFGVAALLALTLPLAHTFGALLAGTLVLWGAFACLLTAEGNVMGSRLV